MTQGTLCSGNSIDFESTSLVATIRRLLRQTESLRKDLLLPGGAEHVDPTRAALQLCRYPWASYGPIPKLLPSVRQV